MRNQSVSRISKVVMVACGLLVAGSSVRAEAEGPNACTNGTLRGAYGYTTEGVLIAIPGLPPEVQFRSLGVARFDGKGHVTWVEHTVVNGTLVLPDWAEATGTYTLDSNCTGTAVVFTPNHFGPLNLTFVVVKQGREVRTVLDTNAIVGVFNKIE
jgi:hypothetical protein